MSVLIIDYMDFMPYISPIKSLGCHRCHRLGRSRLAGGWYSLFVVVGWCQGCQLFGCNWSAEWLGCPAQPALFSSSERAVYIAARIQALTTFSI